MRVDLGVDGADLALEALHGDVRIVGAQGVQDLVDQRLDRRDERLARAVVAHGRRCAHSDRASRLPAR